MKVFELWDRKDHFRFQSNCILVHEFEVPEMYPEYAPGPPDDDPFPEFWNTVVSVNYIDVFEGTCKEMSSTMMKDFYRYIHGMRDRKKYWRIMKYLEHKEK